MVSWIDYRGFRIRLRKTFEDTEERLKRGDYLSKVVGYYFHIWIPKGEGFRRLPDESEDYPTEEIAIDNAQGIVDAIVDSLE